jgi:hypothetical protein
VHLFHMEMVYYYKMSQNVEIVSNLRPRKILAEGSTHGLSTLTFGRTLSLFTTLLAMWLGNKFSPASLYDPLQNG